LVLRIDADDAITPPQLAEELHAQTQRRFAYHQYHDFRLLSGQLDEWNRGEKL
jgi:hypothetical protein